MLCNIFYDDDTLLFAAPLQSLSILFKIYNSFFKLTFNLRILFTIPVATVSVGYNFPYWIIK